MIDRFIDRTEMTADEIADVIWLTLLRESMSRSENAKIDAEANVSKSKELSSQPSIENTDPNLLDPPPIEKPTAPGKTKKPDKPLAGLVPGRSKTAEALMQGVPFKVNNPRSLRDPLSVVRSLKALMRSVPSGEIEGLDEEATARQIAEMGLWQPIVKPKLEPWLDVVVVADESDSMLMWQQSVVEFRNLLRNYGAFRDVQLWGMQCLEEGETSRVVLHPGIGRELKQTVSCRPDELLDPSGRRLILVMTDCVARHWRSAALVDVMAMWGRSGALAVVQVLPEYLWVRTAIRGYESVGVKSFEMGAANGRFGVEWDVIWGDRVPKICVPIVPLEDGEAMKGWSEMVMGLREAPAYGLQSQDGVGFSQSLDEGGSAQRSLERAKVGMSPISRRLLGLLAATPVVTLPVIRLVQETMLRESRQMNVAEVLLCGLLESVEGLKLETEPDAVEYRFRDEAVRGLILADMPLTDTVKVLTNYVAEGFEGLSLESFVAELQALSEGEDVGLRAKARPFALVTAAVLKRKGGKYREWAEGLEARYVEVPIDVPEEAPQPPILGEQEVFPALQRFEFETVTIDEAAIDETVEPELPVLEWRNKRFEFETATLKVVEPKRSLNPFANRKSEVLITKGKGEVLGYVEEINSTVSIKMIAVPKGRFEMGAPKEELESLSSERPQHFVTVPEFWMGQIPVTQAQWKAVAQLKQVKIKLNENPSTSSKGANHPVENVSWNDAIEFCARLSIATGREYRLPSEAQWEYACRAGTTTPFYFGETIDAELANYQAQDWVYEKKTYSGKYGKGRLGEYREKPIPVGTFPANAFGLHDMHGNVWEWCADDWHENYEGAPIDGSVWDASNDSGSDPNKVLRGGSWIYGPWWCRSAFRISDAAGARYNYLGFRVVVVLSLPPRTLR